MYQDTVTAGKRLHNPVFLSALLGIFFVLLYIVDLSKSGAGHLLAPVIGNPETSGLYGRFVVAFTIALAFVVNLYVISFLTFKWQVLVVWAELLSLFLFFFHTFDLSYTFIQSKIGFMITQGVFTTLYVSAISIVIAFLIAIIGAVSKLSTNGFAYGISSFYTSFFRGVPLLVQIYVIYMGLPQLGFVINAVPAGIIALSLCYGAYMTEIFRAGIQSIPEGQWEGSRALGFGFGQMMRRIILPQSIPLIIPPTGNQFIAMLKDSSLVSVLGVWELMFLARKLGNKDFRNLEMLIAAAFIYWFLSIGLEFAQSRIEKHYRRGRSR